MPTDRVEKYVHQYRKLKDSLNWKVPDKRIIMTIALNYALSEKEVDTNEFLQIADEIKGSAHLFSAMRTHSRFMTAAVLDTNFDQPKEKVPELFNTYKLFRHEKFQSGVYTYIAASIVLMHAPLDRPTVVKQIKDLYDQMKIEHAILTTASDYPLATLLAFEEKNHVIQQMETIYQELGKYGFSKGNDLQLLSHILTLQQDEEPKVLINRALQIFDHFREIGVRPKRMYYPVIGMIALLPTEEVNLAEVKEIFDLLMNEKDFKWQKDMNVLFAVCFYMKGKLENSYIAETSMMTTIEAIVQAQQAVMMASIAGAAAASSSNNN